MIAFPTAVIKQTRGEEESLVAHSFGGFRWCHCGGASDKQWESTVEQEAHLVEVRKQENKISLS